MKKTLVALIVATAMVPAVLANQVAQVTVAPGDTYGPYQVGYGGEFTLTPNAQLSWVLNEGYVEGVTKDVIVPPKTKTDFPGSFQTFCVEVGEYIYPNTTFDVSISQASIYTGKPLTQGAAWLYHQFQCGTLAGYDYTRQNKQTVQDLQDAIWLFMGITVAEIKAEDPNYNPNNQFVIAGGVHGGFLLNNGQIPVGVLNMWAAGHYGDPAYARQDQLVCVPDGGLTLTLLGMGLGSLALVSRKLRK
jgi:hypothetical protein